MKGWVLERGFLLKFLEKSYPQSTRIVDIGCGPGHWLKHLHEKGYRNIAGVDLDNYIVFQEIRDLNIFHKADVSFDKLPFDDNSVDIILSMQVFEHLENPFHFERECRRVLKPGGLLIFSYPYAWNIQSRIKFLFTANVFEYRPQNSHINFMTPDIFGKCFLKDFRIVRREFYRGKVAKLGRTLYLPASERWGSGVCYFMEKKYYR